MKGSTYSVFFLVSGVVDFAAVRFLQNLGASERMQQRPCHNLQEPGGASAGPPVATRRGQVHSESLSALVSSLRTETSRLPPFALRHSQELL